MALPALRVVRSRFPEAEIAIVGRPSIVDIYRDQHICDQLIPYDPKGLHMGLSGRERIVVELRGQKFDVALLLQNAFDAAWLAWRANIPERIGYARDRRSFLLTKAIPVPRHGEIPSHEKFYYLELLRRAGWLDSVQDESFIGLHIPEDKRRNADEFLCKSGVRQSALRIAIGAGPNGNSQRALAHAGFAKKFIGVPPLIFWNVQANERFVLHGIQPARAAQEFQIIKLFMRGNFPVPGDRYGLCQKKAAPVTRVSDAFGNIRAPGQPRGIERILQQQGHVELLPAKFHHYPLTAGKPHVQAFRIVRDELIADVLIAINIHDGGPSHDRDFRFRKTAAHNAKCRQRHDGVPDPVRRAY